MICMGQLICMHLHNIIHIASYVAVLEIRNRNWSTFLKIGYFIGYYTAVPLKTHGKLGQSK